MKLRGFVDVVVRDAVSGAVKRTHHQENLVPDATLFGFLYDFANPLLGGKQIALSTTNVAPSRTNSTMTNVVAVGSVPFGGISPTANFAANPPYLQIQNRIDAIGVARTFYQIGLVSYGANSQLNYITTQTYAYLLLSVPLTQGPDEILDIFYRIQFLKTGLSGLNPRFMTDMLQTQLENNFNSFFPNLTFTSPLPQEKPDMPWIDPLAAAFDLVLNSDRNGGTLTWNYAGFLYDFYKFKRQRSYDLGDYIGVIFNSLQHGISRISTAYAWDSLPLPSSPFQTMFTHGPNAYLPFLDTLNLATGSGKPTLSGNWVEGWPQMWRIELTSTGAIGTATYKFSRRYHMGFNGNAYSDRIVHNPFYSTTAQPFVGAHGFAPGPKEVPRHSERKLVHYDATGVSLVDLLNGDYINWDATTLNPDSTVGAPRWDLPATTIGQVASDGTFIWVACRATGLYKLNPANRTVTLITANPTYGVGVGQGGLVWAATSAGLFNSNDWSTPVSFTYTGISDSWTSVLFLRVDPNTSTQRMGFATPTRLVWFSNTTAPTSGPTYGASALRGPWNIAVSTEGRWGIASNGTLTAPNDVCDVGFCQWGGTSANPIINYYLGGVDGTIVYSNGTVRAQKGVVGFLGEYLLNYVNLVDPTTGFSVSGTPIQGQWNNSNYDLLDFWTPLVGGLVCTGKLVWHGTPNSDPLTWETYGWTGSDWSRSSTNSKATHTETFPLVAGVNIAFASGVVAPDFSTGDFYTQGICKGLWKDNATTISFAFSHYCKPVVFDLPFSGTVPSAAPYTYVFPAAPLGSAPNANWLRLETEAVQTIRVNLGGVPVSTVYTNGETPGQNEVSINGVTGLFTFNPASAGRAISGTASYIYNPT